jgi:O-antigen/teichoic acid export membrane protein
VVKWILTVCGIAFPVIFIIGIVFFIRDSVLNIYLLPWILYTVGALIGFFNNSILSFIEGLNKIESIQKIRLGVAALNTAIVTVVLILGGNIYALAFGTLLSSSFIFISIFGTFRNLLKQLLTVSKNFDYNWRKEILALFIKYAFSVSSGYFLFQIYTPLMHYFHGPVYSGKVGITLSLVMAIFNMSYIWMYTITPKINMLISQKAWEDLNGLFKKRTILSLGTYLSMAVILFLFFMAFRDFWVIPKIISRFLPLVSLIIIFVCYFLQLIISCWALYLRGHKQEPYVVPSVLSAIWTAVTTYLAGKYFDPRWFFCGFFSGYIWGTPVCYYIYHKYKRKWHG